MNVLHKRCGRKLAEPQTTELECLFNQAILQPFTDENFANHDDKVRLYSGLRVVMCSKQRSLSSVRLSLEGLKACLCFKNLLWY